MPDHTMIKGYAHTGNDGDELVYVAVQLPDVIFDAITKKSVSDQDSLKVLRAGNVALFCDREGQNFGAADAFAEECAERDTPWLIATLCDADRRRRYPLEVNIVTAELASRIETNIYVFRIAETW
jgi:hypothetical protein